MTARVVVGAAGLLGRHLVALHAREHGTLLAIDAAGPPAGCPVPVLTCDATDPRVRDRLAGLLGRTDRAELYYTAGCVPELAAIRDTTTEDFRLPVERNLVEAFTVMRMFAETAVGCGVPGSMTVLGSVGGQRAHRNLVAYDAAKAALASLVRSFALEYGGAGITTRLVAVGPVAESASTAADGDRLPALIRLVPLGRYATANEIASAVAMIGGPAFDMATGHVLTLDGGLSIQLRPADIERPSAGPHPS